MASQASQLNGSSHKREQSQSDPLSQKNVSKDIERSGNDHTEENYKLKIILQNGKNDKNQPSDEKIGKVSS